MQKNSNVSCLSVISTIVSSISVIAFSLLFSTQGTEKEFVRIIWEITGMSALIIPIIAKYFRKKNGQKGRKLEIIALILGFIGCDFVLIYAVNLSHNIDLVVCITLCVAYAKLFNNITAPVSDEPVECCNEDNQICEAEPIVKCRRCGKEIPSESAYCLHCGKKVKRNVKRISTASITVIIVLAIFILLSFAFLFYCFTNYQNGMNAMFSQNFIAAEMQFSKIPYAERFFKNELEYIRAGVLMEQGDYIEALNAFNDVNYPVPISIIENIQEELYKQSQSYYRKGDYQNSLIGFKAIQDYKNSEDYILLIRGHNTPYIANYDDLLKLIGFEDASEIIIGSDPFVWKYLNGRWESETDDYFFEMGANRTCSYDMPSKKVSGERYRFSKGTFYVEDSSKMLTKLFKFSIVDKNTMDVTCYKNNSIITLYRKKPL